MTLNSQLGRALSILRTETRATTTAGPAQISAEIRITLPEQPISLPVLLGSNCSVPMKGRKACNESVSGFG